MASEPRLRILQLLAAPKVNFSEQWSADPAKFGVCMTLISDALAVSQPTASRHLDILKQAGFIKVRRYQKWAYCKRDETEIADYLAWLKHEISAESETN